MFFTEENAVWFVDYINWDEITNPEIVKFSDEFFKNYGHKISWYKFVRSNKTSTELMRKNEVHFKKYFFLVSWELYNFLGYIDKVHFSGLKTPVRWVRGTHNWTLIEKLWYIRLHNLRQFPEEWITDLENYEFNVVFSVPIMFRTLIMHFF